MEVVEEFLRLRREGKGEEAYQLLAPDASMGCPWGGMHHGRRIYDLLMDESRFAKKGYLDPVPIEKIDDGTYQRKFQWDRGMAEFGNSGYRFLGVLPRWRELYFVRDGKINLVTADKMLKNRSLLHALFGIGSG
ncbi:hypothetical protein JIQ42_02954 [Leishmania sp. Namibia]|uniref:hypothetical protein n=1 Tax=Leishmania sp. Namibia TaxID=2802991 RepID=UPI001B448777|nr:hypothetical protein JIQ42_02954 [Leishmania sp. Namibia]